MKQKPFEPEDPFEMIAQGIPLSAEDSQRSMDEMTESLIDEYFRMGYSAQDLIGLFENPFYQLPHWILKQKGLDYIQEKIFKIYFPL